MIYLEDDTIPRPLYDALVKSNSAYGEELVEFYKTQGHNDMAISTTSLIGAPQQKFLFARHQHEVYIEPVKDLWASFMGSCIHLVLELEAKNNPDYYVEFRLGVMFKIKGKDVLVHGKFDLYNKVTKSLEDWKITRPTSILYDKTDHIMQLNVLAYLMRCNGYEVKTLTDVYMFPHLDNTKVGKMEGYPNRNVLMAGVEILPHKEVEEYIIARVTKHLDNKDRKDKELDPCTDKERWIRPSSYKVYYRKKGGKKGEVQDFSSKAAHYFAAADELDSFYHTDEYLSVDENDIQIRELKGEAKACDYCKSLPFCHQIRKERNEPKPLLS